MVIYEYWIWTGVPVMLAAAVVLGILIVRLITLGKRSRLFAAPMLARQEVVFEDAGRVALAMEGPRFTTRFAGIGFELYGLDRQPVPSRASLMRPRTISGSTSTVERMTFDIPRPGRYVLLTSGLDQPSIWSPAVAVVFLRPQASRMVGYIMGIVAMAMVLITSLVFLILRLSGAGLAE
jgi:hypothetical protein